jgi:hypothetical protein
MMHCDNYFSKEDFYFNYENQTINAYETFKQSYSSVFDNFDLNSQLDSQIRDYLFTILNMKSFSFSIDLSNNKDPNQLISSKFNF